MDAFEIAPSRLIGDLKRALEQAIDRGELEARREDAYYVAHLARHGLVPGVSPERTAALIAAGGALGDDDDDDLEGPHRGVDPETRRRACSRAATIPTTTRACIATPIRTTPSCSEQSSGGEARRAERHRGHADCSIGST